MLKQFEKHLTADGKSPKTLESYLGDVRVNGHLKTHPFGHEGRQIVMITCFTALAISYSRVPA